MVLEDAAAGKRDPAARNVVKIIAGKIIGVVTMITEVTLTDAVLTEIIPAAVTDRSWVLPVRLHRQCPETNLLTWKMNLVPVAVRNNNYKSQKACFLQAFFRVTVDGINRCKK